MNLTEHLLQSRESISLKAARLYLGSRVRARTPLGASEYLMVMCAAPGQKPEDFSEMRGAYNERIEVALDCEEIYRNAFPREYATSPSPFLSIQREQEMYQLVHRHLFPIVWSQDGPVATARGSDTLPKPASPWLVQADIEAEPDFFLPYIPLRGAQEHLWSWGEFEFSEVNLAYQVALALSREFDESLTDKNAACKLLNKQWGLDLPEPALPVAAVGWTEFLYQCQTQPEPLCWLPIAFNAISYKTGIPWLDIPQIGALGMKWSVYEVMKLSIMWGAAKDILESIAQLGRWLAEEPKTRVKLCWKLWNDAAAIEAQSPFAGLRDDELLQAGAAPLGNHGGTEWVTLPRAMLTAGGLG